MNRKIEVSSSFINLIQHPCEIPCITCSDDGYCQEQQHSKSFSIGKDHFEDIDRALTLARNMEDGDHRELIVE